MSLGNSRVAYDSASLGFKNDGTLYTGTVSIATSLTAGQQLITNGTPITVAQNAEFCLFFANYTEYYDVLYSTGVGNQWYPVNVGALGSAGCTVTAPSGSAGPLNFNIVPLITNGTITVQVIQNNPYPNSITISPQTVSFAFAEYSLAD